MSMLGLAVLVITLGVSLGYNCRDVPNVNGCSVWSIVPYKRTFTNSCNKHDVCYACGRTFGITRYGCDKAFLSNMRKACSGWWCRRWAGIYYRAVRAFGSKRYKSYTQAWCKEHAWYRTECLP